jgi:plasmid replication initiation protein
MTGKRRMVKPKQSKNELVKSDLIKTPQSLIHIRHKITLSQYKYWILMLRELRRQFDSGIPTDEKGFRSMPLKLFEKAFGYEINRSMLWNDMLALKNETLSYNFLSKDGGAVQYGAGFISEWKVFATRLEFKFPSVIEDVVRGLDEPKAIFQLLNWEIFNHFSGKYEAIIYKLCRDYRGVKKTPYFDLAKFRDYMGLSDGEYKEFRDLNKFVISNPVKAINRSEASDIRVEVEFERQGRKVIGLRFMIEQKAQTVIPFPESDLADAFRFAKVNIEPAMQKKYLELRREDEIEVCIERANEYGEQQAKKGKEPNYGALYRAAITEGWHSQKLEQKAKEETAEKRRKATRAVEESQAMAQAARDRKEAERIAKILSEFHALDEDMQDEIREQFRATLAIPLRKSFDKQGEAAPMVKSIFAEFFSSTHGKGASQHEKASEDTTD